jgi:WD40 repeat protein
MQYFQHTSSLIAQLAFAPDGETLAAVADRRSTIGLCSMAAGTYRRWNPVVDGSVQSIAFSPKGDVLAVGGHIGLVLPYVVPAFEYNTEYDAGFHITQQIPVYQMVFAPHRVKNPVLATGSAGVMLFGGQQDIILSDRECYFSLLSWSPQGDKIAAYDDNSGEVTLWRLDRKLQPSLAIVQYSLPDPCKCLAFSPDNNWLAMAHRKGVFLEDVRKRHSGPYQVLQGHDGPTLQVVFHPGGSSIATASDDGTVRFWDFATRRQRDCYNWEIGKVTALAFSPDGMRCAAGGEHGRIVVWDVG